MALTDVELNPGAGGAKIRVDQIAGSDYEVVKSAFGTEGNATMVSASNPLPTTDAAAEVSLASIDLKTPTVGQKTMAASTPVAIASDQSAIPISGTVVTGGLTDTQLRATAVPVAGTFFQATQPVSGTFFQATQPVSAASLPLPTLAATSTKQSDGTQKTQVVDGGGNVIGATSNALDVNIKSGNPTTIAVTQATASNLKAQVASTQKPSIGATVVMTVTNLQSLASSATAGWQSLRVSNLATLATDYEIFVKLTTANTAPGSDKAAYIWICPFYTTDAGTTWLASSQGTATLPTGTEGTTTIASPHNLRLLGVLNYTTQQMVLQDTFLLSNCFGNRLPDGFSIIITNFTGAALSTACVVDYSPINDILV